jgi:trans-2,3-dihydro-3-hydroxyanthranilate isomerase
VLFRSPLAVVHEADALGSAQMQHIAREFNLSETVFLQRPTRAEALARLRIFTPAMELPFAGHPTVGTACLLAELGLVPAGTDVRFVLEEGVGPVPLRVRREPGRPVYAELSAARAPLRSPAVTPPELVARTLGIEAGDIGHGGETLRVGDCGLPFLLVPLRVPELLAGLDPDFGPWRAWTGPKDPAALFVYARGYEGELRARMFGPGVGVSEDPATGSACAALGGVLALEHDAADAHLQWTLHQGVEMGRPSVIHIEAERRGAAVVAVRVGGHSVMVTEGDLRAS